MIQIKMFSDIICEWCFLAWKILETLRGSYDFQVEYLWYEIHPDTPIGGMPMKQHNHRPGRFFRILNQLGEPYNVRFYEKTLFVNTRKALLLGEYAREVGKETAYIKTVWNSFMVEGADIGRTEVLEEIALSIGLSPSGFQQAFTDPKYQVSLMINEELSKAYGSESVPTFIVNDEYILTGAQADKTWRELFDKINFGVDS